MARLPHLLSLLLLTAGPIAAALPGQQPDSRAADPVAPPSQPTSGQNRADVATPSAGDSSAALAALSQGDRLMIAAVTALEGYGSMSAKIVYEADLYDNHLVGSGTYEGLWKDGNYLMRMELRIPVGEEAGSLLQVCDGKVLWTKRNLPGGVQLTRLDVARAVEGLKKARLRRDPRMGMLPGIGGLPKSVRGLHGSFGFSAVKEGTWGEPHQPVFQLLGQWRPTSLIKLLPDQKPAIEKGQAADLSRLPAYLPDHVVVFLLAREDLLPFRIEYRRTLPGASPPDPQHSRVMVAMELTDVDLNLPIDPNRFVYNPVGLPVVDETQRFLESLK